MAVLALLACDAWAQDPPALVVVPPGRSVEMRVGERRGFSAVLAEPGVQYAWSLDGTARGQGSAFEFRPTAAYVGRHEVSVTALAGPIAARHTWLVSVEAVGPPTIVRAAPSMAVVRVPAAEPLRFELQAEPAALTDRVTVQWSVDGAPAGDGPFLAVRAPDAGTQRVRAVASSEYGGAVMREWQVVAMAGAEAPPPLPKPSARPALPVLPREVATPPPAAAAKLRLPPAPVVPPPPVGVSEDDVRALMLRYEQAWRTRDMRALRRMGYVQAGDQERMLLTYFATSRDLEMAVHLLEVHIDGGRGVVRFTQRDGFRDAEGRALSAGSAPIERTVVRTRKGVGFAPTREPRR